MFLPGGTYVPMDCLLASDPPADAPQPTTSGLVTGRELAVIRAIQKGKSNKVIAYELNMCESTVKVHVRNIMKKMNARIAPRWRSKRKLAGAKISRTATGTLAIGCSANGSAPACSGLFGAMT